MNNGKICVSVCAETASEFLEKIERAEKAADIIELRFDCLNESQIKQVNKAKASSKPEISTFRSKEQGGKQNLSIEERLNFWNDLKRESLFADFEVDLLEMKVPYNRRQVICSHHDFGGVPANLEEIYQRLKQTNADIIKIAVQANDAVDGLALMKLLERAKAENKDLIPIAMGEHGVWTRILGLSRGAFTTFASVDGRSATAPGQLTARELIDVYRVKELNEKTEIYGLVAGSTAHSVSPQMHNAAFEFNKLNAVYVPFPVKNLEEFMRRMVNLKTREIDWNLRGFSVTLPHKVEIIKYLTNIDETASEIGAVNTVYIVEDDNAIYGTNTDAAGFIEPLRNIYGTLLGAKAAVLGAGGAARAVCYALTKAGVNVKIFVRNLEKAKILQDKFGVEVEQLSSASYKGFDFLVNTTPLGMKKGGLENEIPATAEQLGGVGLVYDLVYNPFQTKLMKEADKVFVPTIGGLAMLVAQAMEQQKVWTGLDAPMKEMSRAALRKLDG